MPDGSPLPYDDRHPTALSPVQGVRVQGLMYIESVGGNRELYDLRHDPHELRTVVDDPKYRGRVQALAGVLDLLRGCVGIECNIGLPPVLRPDAAWRQTPTLDATASPTRLSTLRQ